MERDEWMGEPSEAFSEFPYIEELPWLTRVLLGYESISSLWQAKTKDEYLPLSHLPKDLQGQIFNFLTFYTTASTLNEAAVIIRKLRLVNTTLKKQIDDKDFFEKLVKYLALRFGVSVLDVAVAIHTWVAQDYIQQLGVYSDQLIAAGIAQDQKEIIFLLNRFPGLFKITADYSSGLNALQQKYGENLVKAVNFIGKIMLTNSLNRE
jgi:hypothetical protein